MNLLTALSKAKLIEYNGDIYFITSSTSDGVYVLNSKGNRWYEEHFNIALLESDPNLKVYSHIQIYPRGA